MGTDADYAAGHQSKQQYAKRGGEVLRRPLADAGRQQFTGAADIGGSQGIHQKHHAEAGQPLTAAAEVALCQGTEAGIGLFMLIDFDQQQRGITHQQPQAD
ncbi:hypothetical protein D3C72_1234510 [compost metagenome]